MHYNQLFGLLLFFCAFCFLKKAELDSNHTLTPWWVTLGITVGSVSLLVIFAMLIYIALGG
jgi:hypothetical protein